MLLYKATGIVQLVLVKYYVGFYIRPINYNRILFSFKLKCMQHLHSSLLVFKNTDYNVTKSINCLCELLFCDIYK